MKVTMRDEDRRAMDVVLDRAAAAGKTPRVLTYAAANGPMRESVARLEKVLGLLDKMTVGEPPRDLVSRTIQFVEQSGAEERQQPHPSLFDQPPVG